jgi:hypothetical protein
MVKHPKNDDDDDDDVPRVQSWSMTSSNDYLFALNTQLFIFRSSETLVRSFLGSW